MGIVGVETITHTVTALREVRVLKVKSRLLKRFDFSLDQTHIQCCM